MMTGYEEGVCVRSGRLCMREGFPVDMTRRHKLYAAPDTRGSSSQPSGHLVDVSLDLLVQDQRHQQLLHVARRDVEPGADEGEADLGVRLDEAQQDLVVEGGGRIW
jgi:hypothetical protein